MEDDQPVKPANILNIVATNQGRRPLTRETPKAAPLTPHEVRDLMAEGHRVVDARSPAAFGAGHLPGAYNVQKSSSEFEQRVGWVLPDDAPIILVTDSAAEAQACVYEMAFIGLDQFVSGYLEGGIEAWMAAGLSLDTLPQMDVHTLRERLSSNGLQVLDVREAEEWSDGHIDGAHFMPYTSLVQQLDVPPRIDELKLTRDQQIAVTCATGNRSSTAASVLAREGFGSVFNVTGGMTAWRDAGFPVVGWKAER